MKVLNFKNWLFGIVIITGLIACNKENNVSDDVFAEEIVEDIQLETRSGNGDCFELVWPIEITFPDGSTQEVADRDALKAAIMAWRAANPDATRRPQISFPIEVITQDGEVVTVDSKLALLRLRKECKGRPHLGDKRPCFRLNYPISLTFPNGTESSYESGRAMAQALRRWKKANPAATEHPMMIFPLTVTMRDGEIISVESKEALRQLKVDCN